MPRATLLALVPLASALWLRPADACTCGPADNRIVHPPGNTIPAHDGLVGRLLLVNTPTISVTYTDDPASTPIAGAFRVHAGPGGVSATWTFVPRDPLTVGRTVRAVVQATGGGSAPVASSEFLVSSSTIATPPSFAGLTGMEVILTRIRSSLSTTCDIGPEQSRVALELALPSAGAPLYRYFFYRQGTPPPAEPTMYGVPSYSLSYVACGYHSLRCAPDVPMDFQPGETWCARVEATDLMGYSAGYDREVCTTVTVEDVDVVDFGGMSACRPVASGADAGPVVVDTGVVADSGVLTADAGVAAVDAGSGGGDSTDSDGCTCVRPRAGGSYAGLASMLLGLAWVLMRRRRERA